MKSYPLVSDDPFERTGTPLSHHSIYNSEKTQNEIENGLTYIKSPTEHEEQEQISRRLGEVDFDEVSLVIGGRIKLNWFKAERYAFVEYVDDEFRIHFRNFGESREIFETKSEVIDRLDEVFPSDSVVGVALVRTLETPFVYNDHIENRKALGA